MPILALKILKNACAEEVLFSCSTSSFSWSPLNPFPSNGEVDLDSVIAESFPYCFTETSSLFLAPKFHSVSEYFFDRFNGA